MNNWKDDFDYVYDFEEGLALVVKDGKYGFVNKKGDIVIPLIYDDVCDFYGVFARVEKDGEIFYINKKGERV